MKTSDKRWKFDNVDIVLIDEASLNANIMSETDFRKLCENIRISGLSSAPACYKKKDGRYTIISGHHRIRACKELGWKEIGILYVEEDNLTKDEIIAIQLSHNSLHGEDDKNILKQLFSEIKSVDFKRFAHIDIDEIGASETASLSIIPTKEVYTINVILYKDGIEYFEELFSEIKDYVGKSDVILLADQEPNEALFHGLRKIIYHDLHIHSTSIAFKRILELALKQIKEEIKKTE